MNNEQKKKNMDNDNTRQANLNETLSTRRARGLRVLVLLLCCTPYKFHVNSYKIHLNEHFFFAPRRCCFFFLYKFYHDAVVCRLAVRI